MKKEEAIEKLKRQIQLISHLKLQPIFSSDFTKWKRETEIAIEIIFGENARHIKEFKTISYSPLGTIKGGNQQFYEHEVFRKGLDKSRTILESMVQEIEDYWNETSTNQHVISYLNNVELICNGFHLTAKQLKKRHSNRATIKINDEYDVQDLFHALLYLYFDDIRDEEWNPSYAGTSSRSDFLLKQEKTVIEIKKTRSNLTAKEVGEQLIIDIQKYKSHPDCQTLVCFVYDPDGIITNPRGIENDLSKISDGLVVKVFIRPK